MRPSALSVILSASLAAPAPTFAAATAKVPKVAILDLKSVGAFEPKTVQGLSAVVASEAQRFPIKAIAGADLGALIGFEKSRALMGCADGVCLAEVGGALGVEYLLATEVSEVGGVWLLSATLLDVARAAALRRVTKRAQRTSELVELASQAASEALEALAVPAAPRRPAASLSPEAGAEAVAAPSRQRTAGYLLAGAGAALIAGGAVSGAVAMTSYDAARRASTAAEFESARKRGKAATVAADVLYGAGGAALVAGLLAILTAPSRPASIAISPAAVGSGAPGLALAGSF